MKNSPRSNKQRGGALGGVSGNANPGALGPRRLDFEHQYSIRFNNAAARLIHVTARAEGVLLTPAARAGAVSAVV